MRNKFDILSFLQENFTQGDKLILLGDVVDSWLLYEVIFERILKFPNNVSIISENEDNDLFFKARCMRDIQEIFFKDYFSLNVKAIFHEKMLKLYNEPVSNISCALIDENFTDDMIYVADAVFMQNIDNNRIGFGEDGKKFVKLIIDFIRSNGMIDEKREDIRFKSI